MALRLLEMVVPEEHLGEVEELLREEPVAEIWYDQISEKQTLLKMLAVAEETEHLIDLLKQRFADRPWFRLILLPVVASVPRVEEPPAEEAAPEEEPSDQKKKERISREELYEAVRDMASLTRVYLGMVALSTVVAAVGLLNDSVAVIIGAMVIAPLLGPIIAQAMGTTLGDAGLTRLAFKTNVAGLTLALGLSILLGLFLEVHPTGPELADRTSIGLGDIAVALASGGAGALAFTAGVSHRAGRRHGGGGAVAAFGGPGAPPGFRLPDFSPWRRLAPDHQHHLRQPGRGGGFLDSGGAPYQLVGGEAGPKGDEDFHRRLRRPVDPSSAGDHPGAAD